MIAGRRQRTDLPIEGSADEIIDAVATGSLVLTAEPGAGKSSVVPLLVAAALERGHQAKPGEPAEHRHARIVVLEPRRLAARATAGRLASLLGEDRIGRSVGLTIRGDRRVSDATRIEVVTEAVLTARLQRDPELPGVGAIVFDEFHERNLHSDLALAMAIEVRSTIRPDLAIVVMSATLETEPVAALLATDRIVTVPGRTFPVETDHRPRPSRDRWAGAVAEAAREALADRGGDVLVFVPGRREIADVIDRLSSTAPGAPGRAGVDLIALHGGSDGATERRALEAGSGGSRRVIVATAVAETSVTIPGIETVVDGGLLRRARFDPATGLGRLETVHVTRFAADQRRGRAGRLGPGRCIRLWSAEDHRLLDETMPPEIVDGDPLPVTYELARWGDPDGRSLPLLDHPGDERLAAGRRLLAGLDLLSDDGSLSDRGRTAGALGVHPRLAALLLTAADHGLAPVGARIAALLDDDRLPRDPDLLAELERRWRDLGDRADRLLARLPRASDRPNRPGGPDQQGARRSGRSQGGRTGGDRPTAAGQRSGGPARGRAQLAEVGDLLATAWPDRVAARRPDGGGRYLLTTGREVSIRAEGSLDGAEFLVVAEADGQARQATIRRAVGIDRATVTDALADSIDLTDEVVWDERTSTVRAERQRRLGAIVLHREPLADPPPEAVAAAIVGALRSQRTDVGLGLLSWTERATGIRDRLAWLNSVDPGSWPPVDDGALLDRLDEWLDTSRLRSMADLASIDVAAALLSLLDWQQRRELDRLAPVELDLPTGRRRLDYATGRPVWSVQIQRLFGLDEHPTVGPAGTPVTIELLSPAGRPAQVTTDLPGFWRGSYAEVRRELRGRYPKHRWPEEPWRP